MLTILMNLPIIIAAVVVGLGALLVIDSESYPTKSSQDKNNPHDSGIH